MDNGYSAQFADDEIITCSACRCCHGFALSRTSFDGHCAKLDLTRGERLEAEDVSGCLTMWGIAKGNAASCTIFEDGRRQIVAIERPGDVVCGLMPGKGTQSWLEALEDCEIWQIDLSQSAPELRGNADFLAATFAITHRRLAQSQERISALGRLDSQERVLLFLAENSVQQTRENPMQAVSRLRMSREDIADYLGLNAETVSRLITRIRKSGLVKFLNRTEYVVPDMDALRRRLPMDIELPARSCQARLLMEALQ